MPFSLPTISNTTLNKIVYIEYGCEFVLGVPTFLFNLYTVFQISRVATFNSNLKIVLCSASLATAFVAIFHPVLNAIPRDWYSIEQGKYRIGILMYTLFYLTHSCNVMANLKFIIIAIERKYAFRKRRYYEYGNTFVGRLIAFTALGISFGFAIIKITAFLLIPWPGKTFDDKLFAAFSFDGSVYHYSFAYLVAGFAFFYAIYEFNQQTLRVRRVRYTGRSLSERYEIKQTRDVVNLMRALLKVYGFLYVIACFGLVAMLYVYFWLGCSEFTPCYHLWGNIGYICLQLYNLFYAIYVTWYFPQLRKLILNDFCCCFTKKHQVQTQLSIISKTSSHENHFNILKTVWDSTDTYFTMYGRSTSTSD